MTHAAAPSARPSDPARSSALRRTATRDPARARTPSSQTPSNPIAANQTMRLATLMCLVLASVSALPVRRHNRERGVTPSTLDEIGDDIDSLIDVFERATEGTAEAASAKEAVTTANEKDNECTQCEACQPDLGAGPYLFNEDDNILGNSETTNADLERLEERRFAVEAASND